MGPHCIGVPSINFLKKKKESGSAVESFFARACTGRVNEG